MMGTGPVNCPTAVHEASEAHEMSLSPPVGNVEFQLCVPMLGLGTTDQLPPLSDMTRGAGVGVGGRLPSGGGARRGTRARHPLEATLLRPEVQVARSRTTCPCSGSGSTACVSSPRCSASRPRQRSRRPWHTRLPEETVDDAVAQRWYRRDRPGSVGKGLDEGCLSSAGGRAREVVPTATQEPTTGQETANRKSPVPFGALGAVLVDHNRD